MTPQAAPLQSDPRVCPCGARRDDRYRCPQGCVAPLPGPQERFLSLTCLEALYGGAAGGGKTFALLLDFLRGVGKGYGRRWEGIFLEREMPAHYRYNIPLSLEIFPRLGGRFAVSRNCWIFPEGEVCWFGHAEAELDIEKYKGQQFTWIGFNELTNFTRYMYTFMLGRMRSAEGVPCRVRSNTNPGGKGHAWVFKHWGAWLDPKAAHRAVPGEVRHYVVEGETEVDVPAGTRSSAGDLATGRTFIPARLSDNPALASTNYAANLARLDPVTRAQLRDGDWLVAPAAGRYFKRGWFKVLPEVPIDVADRCRYWDLAGTKFGPRSAKDDPDWACGARMSRLPSGLWVLEHMARDRGTPGDVRALFKAVAESEPHVAQWLERDPGQAGVDQVWSYVTSLPHLIVRGRKKPTDQNKITAAGPLSGQAQAGNVAIVAGAWNDTFFAEAEAFPDGAHDDQIDAAAGAYACLLSPPVELPQEFVGGRRRC